MEIISASAVDIIFDNSIPYPEDDGKDWMKWLAHVRVVTGDKFIFLFFYINPGQYNYINNVTFVLLTTISPALGLFGLSDARHVASPTLPARCCQCACRQFGYVFSYTFSSFAVLLPPLIVVQYISTYCCLSVHTLELNRFIQLRPCTNGCRNYKPCQESTLPRNYISRYILRVSLVSNNHTHTRHHHLRA